jgi:hypothetical protein
VERFGEMLEAYANKMIDLATVLHDYSGREQTLSDRWSAFYRLQWTCRTRSFLVGMLIKAFRLGAVAE